MAAEHGAIAIDFPTGALLLVVVSVVAILTRRLRLPYSVGLVLAGIALAVSPFAPMISLTKELVFTVLLPPLLFEAAFNLHWNQLRRNFGVVAVLASLGVVLSALVTATGMRYFTNWSWIDALVFGALITATDPVSVIATFKEANAKGRLLVLIEGESLFNDGTAAVAFGILVAIAAGHQFTPLGIATNALQTIGGGVLCGAVVALATLLLAGQTEDHLVEITFTTVAAYASFLVAEDLGVSGVLATITAGLVIGNFEGLGISKHGKVDVEAFWEYVAFIANSMVFLLIGMREAHQKFIAIWGAAVVAVALVTLGRAVAIYPCCLLFARTPLRVSMSHQHVLFWGGLRGAVALALALGLPSEVKEREKIVTISFAVVAFSVFAQGLTMKPFLRMMGEIPALGERLQHVPELISSILPTLNKVHGCRVTGVSDDVLGRLKKHRWPGDIRELRNVLEWAAIVAGEGIIEVKHLPEQFRPDMVNANEVTHRVSFLVKEDAPEGDSKGVGHHGGAGAAGAEKDQRIEDSGYAGCPEEGPIGESVDPKMQCAKKQGREDDHRDGGNADPQ